MLIEIKQLETDPDNSLSFACDLLWNGIFFLSRGDKTTVWARIDY